MSERERYEAWIAEHWTKPAAQAVPSDVERDAERYRWLRDANKSDAALPYDELIALSMDSLDAAIDEEIGKA